MTYRSDKADGPTAGTATVDPLEFLARLVTHIPDPGQVMQRYYGWYASRTRGLRRRQATDAAEAPVAIVDPVDWSLRAARLRWAELLRRIFEVDPLACPRCREPMRIVAVITEPAVITRILAQRARARDSPSRSRSPPPRRRRSPAPTAAGHSHPSSRAPGSGAAGVPGCRGGGDAPPCDGRVGRGPNRTGPGRGRHRAPRPPRVDTLRADRYVAGS